MQDMAKSRPIDLKGQRSFKILILNEVDRLSREAQASLRRTMEKYSAACRLVMACNNVSKVRYVVHVRWLHPEAWTLDCIMQRNTVLPAAG